MRTWDPLVGEGPLRLDRTVILVQNSLSLTAIHGTNEYSTVVATVETRAMADLWYFTHGGKQMEPVTAGELKAHANSGFLTPNDLVWKEGMAAWVKAGTLKGLFPPGRVAPAASSAPSPKPAPAKESRSKYAVSSLRVDADGDDDDAVDEPRPKKRRRDDDDDDYDRDDQIERRDIRKRSRSKSGMSGLTIGLIVGGVVLVLLIGAGIAAFALFSGGSNDFRVSLGPTSEQDRTVTFQAGNTYEIRVTSAQQTDVDLHVLDPNHQMIALDESIGPNSFISLVAPSTGRYTLRVRNLDRMRGNQSHVVVKNLGKVAPRAAQVVPPIVQPKIAMPQIPRPQIPQVAGKNNPLAVNPIPDPKTTHQLALAPGGRMERTIVCSNAKEIHVGVESDNPANDVDVFVYRAPGRQQVASDIGLSHNCRTSFQAQAKTTYVIEVVNLGPNPANGSLTHTLP